MKYQVTVGSRTFQIEVDEGRVVVDGVTHQAELRMVDGTPLRLLLLDGRSSVFPLEPAGPTGWVVQELGERFEVEAVDERTAHIRSLVGADGARPGPVVLKAPMPGLVVRVPVEPGQQVAAGASLVVLEAMKMENDLRAAGPAVVERIAVAAGQAVEKGQVLMTFAAP